MGVQIEKDNSISISGFDGIGQSPLSDFTDIMGINTRKQGVASCEFKFQKLTSSDGVADKTFTYFNGRDWNFGQRISYRGQEDYLPITVSSTGTLPTALEEDTIYYVKYYTTSGGAVYYRFYPTLKDAFAGTNFINEQGAGTGTIKAHYVLPSKITDYTTNSNDQIFALDDNQRVWFLGRNASEPFYLISGNESGGWGQGIIYYKGYIIVFGGVSADALLDISSPGTDAVTWTNSFLTGIEPSTKPFYSINDDSIYFGNGSTSGRFYKIALFEENAGKTFAPGTSNTFDLVVDALTLPYERATTEPTVINEIDQLLVVGTDGDKIYFWDKKSPAFTTYLKLPEEDVVDIKVVDNTMYIIAGNKGNMYISNTTQSQTINLIPEHLTNRYDDRVNITYDSVDIYDGKLLVALSYITGTTTAESYIMSYDFLTNQILKFNESADGYITERNGSFYGRILKIIPQGNNIFLSTQKYDDDLGDYIYNLESLFYGSFISTTKKYSFHNNYNSYIQTGLIPYGTYFSKKTVRNIYISLMRELEVDNGIRIHYRRNDNSAWTLLKTIDYTTNGAIKDFQIEAPITNIIDIQFKIELSGKNMTTPYLKLIKLIP